MKNPAEEGRISGKARHFLARDFRVRVVALVVTVAVGIPAVGVLLPSGRASAATSGVSAVGSLATTAGSGVTKLSVHPHKAGDALVVLVHIVASNAIVTSISGGGSSRWARYQRYLDTPSWSGQPHDTEIWVGKVSSTGSSTIKVSYSKSVHSSNIDLDAQEFGAGQVKAPIWSFDAGSGRDNEARSRHVAYPALRPSTSAELYFGYAWVPGTSTRGSTPGVTYDVTADGNLICFDPDVSTQLAPFGSQTARAPSAAIAVLIRVHK